MLKDNKQDTNASERDRINAMTDEQIAQKMQERWERNDHYDAPWTTEQEHRLWQRIQEAAGLNTNKSAQRNHTATIKQLFMKAAVVLLPIFMLSTVWLFYLNQNPKHTLTTVETGAGEKATVSLPDGSTVRLNYGTRLTYDPTEFQGRTRSATIDGEARFKVSKDAAHPFTVNARGMRIKVLGTTFNVRARSTDNRTTVLLEEGKVHLNSTVSSSNVILLPVQKATLDYATNSIRVSQAKLNDASTAWHRGELKFEDEPLAVVLSTIEGNYGLKFINASTSHMLNDRFSGTLPSNNLNEALDILEHTYNVTLTVNEKKIKIIRK